MLIRPLVIGDMEALAGLYCQFWNENSDVEKMRGSFQAMRDDDAYILLGAADGDTLVGSVMGVVCRELYGDCRPFLVLEDMIVDRQYRGRGIGKLLFAELERQAALKSCTQIILVTDASREDACGFYASVGFHPTANRGYKKKIK